MLKQKDIRVRDTGGLNVIDTDRQESHRVDNQLRVRADRQGHPGGTRLSFLWRTTCWEYSVASGWQG